MCVFRHQPVTGVMAGTDCFDIAMAMSCSCTEYEVKQHTALRQALACDVYRGSRPIREGRSMNSWRDALRRLNDGLKGPSIVADCGSRARAVAMALARCRRGGLHAGRGASSTAG